MNAISVAIDALFSEQNLGRDALWKSGGVGSGVAVRVMMKSPDQVVGIGDSRAVLPTALIDVRRSDVSSPASGDIVEIDGETFTIIATPTIDAERLIWTCEASPQI